MYDEKKAKELCRVLRLIEAEQRDAKDDAKRHKARIDDLWEEAKQLREDLENRNQPILFGDPPQTMNALDDTPGDEGGGSTEEDGEPEL